ncbi:MAG: hypothetical protein JNM58_02190 [Xanthomonadaceae bacterium]|nr:hypothetical protein [Xanthomonadaceae bacterium]
MKSLDDLNDSPINFLKELNAKHALFSTPPPIAIPKPFPKKIRLEKDQQEHKALLTIDYDDSANPHRITYEWSSYEIRFMCGSTPQILEIYLHSFDAALPEKIPRFFIRDVKCLDKAPVKAIQYYDQSIANWTEFKSGTYFPDGTNAIRLSFEMKQDSDPNHHFKIDVIAFDIVHNREVHCDPLVGNDPPGSP